MNPKQKDLIILASLILLLFIIDYPFLDKAVENFLGQNQEAFVERVIDGDTLVIENETSVRLLGINTPERGDTYYEEAKKFLEDFVLNKTVELEFGKERYDMYDRMLAYLYINRESVNLGLVEEGLANIYFPSGKDVHYKEFKEAWENCIENNSNLCEASTDKCSQCIQLEEFDHKDQVVIFQNTCNFSCDLNKWQIKDEGRKKFIFPRFVLGENQSVEVRVGEGINSQISLFWKNESYVWTDTGDTLFLRDKEEKLVLWESY
jgi:micrococcal nuclease